MTATLPVVPDTIPAELKAQHRWLNWTYGEPRRNGKPPKVPVIDRRRDDRAEVDRLA